MLVMVAYDVNTESEEGRRQRRRVAKRCEDCGQRVRKSVFECLVDWQKWTRMRADSIHRIEPGIDSRRFCFLGDNWKRKVEHIGAKPAYGPQGHLVV